MIVCVGCVCSELFGLVVCLFVLIVMSIGYFFVLVMLCVVMIMVDVLFEIWEEFFVVMELFLVKVGCSFVSVLIVVLGWMFLFFVICMGLFWCWGMLMVMILVLNILVFCDVVVCWCDSVVMWFWVLWVSL